MSGAVASEGFAFLDGDHLSGFIGKGGYQVGVSDVGWRGVWCGVGVWSGVGVYNAIEQKNNGGATWIAEKNQRLLLLA